MNEAKNIISKMLNEYKESRNQSTPVVVYSVTRLANLYNWEHKSVFDLFAKEEI